MEARVLEEIGLTKGEVAVYYALLELGSVTITPIVEKAKVSSSKVYNILDRLIDKGLVSYVIKENTKYFEAASPKRILDYMGEKERRLNEQKLELKKIIPQLELKSQLSRYKSEATIFKGLKGIETAFYSALDSLKACDEMLVIGIPIRSEAVNNFFIKFQKEKAKRKIRARYLVNEAAKNESRVQLQNTSLTEIRYIPETTPAALNIFKDRVIIFPETKELLLISIESKEVAQSFRNNFELLWNQRVTVVEGADKVTSFFTDILSNLKTGEEYFVLNANWGIGNVKNLSNFFYEYHRNRSRKGIKVNFLFNQNLANKVDKLALQPAEYKFLPPDFKSPLQVTFYKNKLYLSLWTKNPIGFLIDSKELVNSFRSYFDNLWYQETRVIKGLDPMQELWEEMLEAGEVDLIGARGYFVDMRPDYVNNWEKRAMKIGMKWRNIVDIGTKGHRITKFPFAQTKYTIPKEFSKLSVFWIYGNKVVISNWVEKEPIAVIIENKNLHDMYKEQFEILWNQETRMLKGHEGMIELCEEVLENNIDLYLIGATGLIEKTHPAYFKIFCKKCQSKGINFHILANEDIKGKHFLNLRNAEIKYLPLKVKSPITIWVFNDNVAHVLSQDPQIVTFTKNQEIAKRYKEYFKSLWNNVAIK